MGESASPAEEYGAEVLQRRLDASVVAGAPESGRPTVLIGTLQSNRLLRELAGRRLAQELGARAKPQGHVIRTRGTVEAPAFLVIGHDAAGALYGTLALSALGRALADEPIMKADKPWEEGSFIRPVSVIPEPDGSRLRLYCLVWHRPDFTKNLLCVAHSTDAFTWEKPDLGEGNNIVLRPSGHKLAWGVFHPTQVICDPNDENEEMRWKCSYWGRPSADHYDGMCLAASPDEFGEVDFFTDTPWYSHFTADASAAYDPVDVTSNVREVMYARSVDGSPEYFVVFDDLLTTAALPVDWIAHTFGDLAVNGSAITITQADAAADVTVLAPAAFTHEFGRKTLEELRVPERRGADEADFFVKVRPATASEATRFLIVIAPRSATDPPTVVAEALHGEGFLGARITHGNTVDVALFALEAPQLSAEGIELTGRSCFVRRTNGQLTAYAVEQGEALTVDGQVAFAGGRGGGQIATQYDPDGASIAARLDGAAGKSLWVARPPEMCLIDGREAAFEYDADTETVRIPPRHLRTARIAYR